jgi:hypothetical protein
VPAFLSENGESLKESIICGGKKEEKASKYKTKKHACK